MKVMFGVVRDKDGKPCFDGDPNDLPPQILCQFSAREREEIGAWPGAFALDAQGVKRLTVLSGGRYRAVDSLVAVSELLDEGQSHPIQPRRDVPAGGTLTLE